MNKRIKKKHDVIPHNMSINRFRKMLIKYAALSKEDAKTLNVMFNEIDRHKEKQHENNNN